MALDNWFSRKTGPLTGAPAIRRIKTYSAQTGYVYSYWYEGQRPLEAGGAEFVFRVSSGGKEGSPVSVYVPGDAIRAWEDASARQLSSTERYAIAKMALFQAFDERPTPASMSADVDVRPADLAAILDTLGI